MASNFTIFVYKNSENTHLKLSGDFDETSAYELLNTLRLYCRGSSGIFIHTNCLEHIYSPGREVFQSEVGTLNGTSFPITFTGDNARKLAPENSAIL